MINLYPDYVLNSGVSLKDYLHDAIEEITNDFIDVAKTSPEEIPKSDLLSYLGKYKSVLNNIDVICKNRKRKY